MLYIMSNCNLYICIYIYIIYIYIYIYLLLFGVIGVLCMVVQMFSEHSNPIQYTLKMGCLGSSVHTLHSSAQPMQLPPSSREQHSG